MPRKHGCESTSGQVTGDAARRIPGGRGKPSERCELRARLNRSHKVGIAVVALVVLGLLLAVGVWAYDDAQKDQIAPGVKIGGVDGAAAGIPGDPGEDAALAAAIDGLLHHPVDVRVGVQLARAERVALAVVGDDDRLLQRLHHLALDHLASGVRAAPADVDPADLDARRDLVLLRVVVGPDSDGEQQAEHDQRHHGDCDLVGSVQPRAQLTPLGRLSPVPEFYGPRPPSPSPRCIRNRVCGQFGPLREAHFRMPHAMPSTDRRS